MPEDSWVPFHLEVGRKLVEGEWWLEEKRADLTELIKKLRAADLWGATEGNKAIMIRLIFIKRFANASRGKNRMGCYEILKDELGVDARIYRMHRMHISIYGISTRDGVGKKHLTAKMLARCGTCFVPPLKPTLRMKKDAETISRRSSIGLTNRVASIGGQESLSTWLYLIDPTKFVHIHRFDQLGILEDLGLGTTDEMKGQTMCVR